MCICVYMYIYIVKYSKIVAQLVDINNGCECIRPIRVFLIL